MKSLFSMNLLRTREV